MLNATYTKNNMQYYLLFIINLSCIKKGGKINNGPVLIQVIKPTDNSRKIERSH